MVEAYLRNGHWNQKEYQKEKKNQRKKMIKTKRSRGKTARKCQKSKRQVKVVVTVGINILHLTREKEMARE